MNRGAYALGGDKALPPGLLSARPAATGSGRLYTATDLGGGTTFVDSAAGWVQIAGPTRPTVAPDSYNVIATNLYKWRAAVSKVRAGTANAKILMIGDSTTQGNVGSGVVNVQQSYPTRLAQLLDSYFVPSNYDYVRQWSSSTADSRITYGSGWSTGGDFAQSTSGATGTVAYTPIKAFDSFTVYWVRNAGSGGTVDVNVDGGASLGTIATGAAGAQAIVGTTFTVTRGTHTINIVGSVGGQSFISGIETFDSTIRQVKVINGGQGGTTAAGWANNTAQVYTIGRQAETIVPDLCIINLGVNDSNGAVSPTAYRASLNTLITNCQTAGADVILCASQPAGNTNCITYQPIYVPYLVELAAARSVPLIDFTTRWGSYATANALGWYAEALHPSTFGYADLATAVFNVLKTI